MRLGFLVKLALAAAIGVGLYQVSIAYPNSMDARGALLAMALFAILAGALLFAPGRRRSEPAPQRPAEGKEQEPVSDRSSEVGSEPRRGPRPLTHLVAWVAIFGFLVAAYDNRDALRITALSLVSALAPGEPVVLAPGEVVLSRGAGGHFVARADINGASLRMLVDTGATDIAIPFEDARRVGVDPTRLTFDRAVLTANGQALVAPVRLSEVSVGDIRLTNVSAAVAEPGKLSAPLLGMSFLGRLSEFVFRGEKLILRE